MLRLLNRNASSTSALNQTPIGASLKSKWFMKPTISDGAPNLPFSTVSSQYQPPKRILITGACGQLGLALAHQWQNQFGANSVIASDIRRSEAIDKRNIPFRFIDVMNESIIEKVIVEEQTDAIVHFSAMLSFIGEQHPEKALDLNCRGFESVLRLAKKHQQVVFCPSTIGVFGDDTPRDNVPDLVITRPNTIYGISKVHTELLGQYYHERFGVDFRSLRYPGILSADTLPGGGTTDYAIDIFHQLFKEAQRHSREKAHASSFRYIFKSPLPREATLPMMFIDDCLNGTIQFITAPLKDCTHLSRVYNVTALSFNPEELATSLSEFLQRRTLLVKNSKGEEREFKVDFDMDFNHVDPMRAKIARSWPRSLDDSRARASWEWKPKITQVTALVEKMATDMAKEFDMEWKA